MKINLIEDYNELMIERIKKSGLKLPKNLNVQGAIIQYFSYLRKKQFAGPHKIVKSKEFTCPSECEQGFKKLENIIKNGGDITPYFNRTAFNLEKYDDLFSDWGVLHFHLGEELIKGENLVTRGDPVLFAYLKNDTVYFINIYSHGHWTDKGVIQTMYNNWPELLEPFILKGVTDVSYDVSPTELKKLRENGVVTLFKIRGKNGENICLMPPGLGVNAARSSVNDTRIYMDICNRLKMIEDMLISKEQEIKEKMIANDIKLERELSLKLTDFNQDNLLIIEEKAKYPITAITIKL